MQSLSDIVASIGPFTRAYCISSAALTFLTSAKIVPIGLVCASWSSVKRGQIWRLITPVLLQGQMGPNLIMNILSAAQVISTLENDFRSSQNIARKHRLNHLFSFTVFVGVVSVLIMSMIVPQYMLGSNLIMFFTYLWARLHDTEKASLYGVFTVNPIWLPYVSLALSACSMEGLTPALGKGGALLAAHIYYYFLIVYPTINNTQGPVITLMRYWDKMWKAIIGDKKHNIFDNRTGNRFNSLNSPNGRIPNFNNKQEEEKHSFFTGRNNGFKGTARHISGGEPSQNSSTSE